MKQLFSTWLIAIFMVGLSLQGTAQKYLKKIQERGELRVGMTAQQPPFSMKDKKGTIIGFEVDLAEMLAEGMGVKLTIVEVPFADLLKSLEEGKIDMVMSGMTMTTKRNLKTMFLGPYVISGKSILTRSPSYSSTDDVDDLNVNSIKVVVLKGSTSETFVKKEMPEAELLLGTDYNACIQMLMDKKAQIMVADYPICVYTAQVQPEKGLITIDKPLTIEPIGAALPVDAAHFINLVENFMNRLLIMGVIDELQAYWFESGEWIDQVEPAKSFPIY